MRSKHKNGDRSGKSRLRVLLPMIWCIFMLLSLWMYSREGKYHHMLRIELEPSAREFQIEVVSGGRGIDVFSVSDDLRINSKNVYIGDRTWIIIDVTLTDENVGSGYEIFLLCDDDSEKGNWTVDGGKGAGRVRAFSHDQNHIIRYYYPLLMLLFGIIMAGCSWAMGCGIDRKPALQKLSEIKEADHKAYEAGIRWFHLYDKCLHGKSISEDVVKRDSSLDSGNGVSAENSPQWNSNTGYLSCDTA